MSIFILSKSFRHMKTNKKLTDPHLLEQLEKIGLGETDALVYLASIHIWACSLGQLSTHTWINRITTHDSVWRLLAKWLLLETFSGKRRLIFPQQISHLQHLVDLKKAELDELHHNVNTTIGLLQSLHLQSAYLPQVTIAKWRQWITDMVNEIKTNTAGPIRLICDSWHFDELLNVHFLDATKKMHYPVEMILPAWFEHFIFSAHAKGVSITTKILDEQSSRTWWMTLWWSKVALHAYEGVYITTTIIDNSPIAQMMQACFEAMWNS